MARLEDVEATALRRALSEVTGAEAATQLALALTYLEADVTVPQLAERYGVAVGVVDDWFRRLETEPLADALAGLERVNLSRRARTPVGSRDAPTTVEYPSEDAVRERGWDLEDPALFERADEAGLDEPDRGSLTVAPGQSLLEAAEAGWPAACYGGACSNCAVLVVEGEVAMSGDHVLPDRVVREHRVRLACVGTPVTDEVKLVYGVRHLDELEEFLLPESGFAVEP
jgi:ferredoxin/transposase-like protein